MQDVLGVAAWEVSTTILEYDELSQEYTTGLEFGIGRGSGICGEIENSWIDPDKNQLLVEYWADNLFQNAAGEGEKITSWFCKSIFSILRKKNGQLYLKFEKSEILLKSEQHESASYWNFQIALVYLLFWSNKNNEGAKQGRVNGCIQLPILFWLPQVRKSIGVSVGNFSGIRSVRHATPTKIRLQNHTLTERRDIMNGIQTYASNNLASVLLSGYSQMNNVRLQMALANKETAGLPSAMQSPTTGSLSLEDTDFLKNYQNQMLELKDLADKTLKGGDKSRLAAGAENLNVAEASGKLGSTSDRYTLTVEQLASGQINRSVEMDSKAPMPSMGGALKIRTEQGNFEFYLSAAGTKNNREMLDNFAAKINGGKTGVTASVKEKDGKAYLQLTGASGEENAFSVSGSLAERLSLDQTAQYGQDAVYTVQKNDGEIQRFTSESNTISLGTGLTASLKGVGTTEIKAGVNASSGMANAVSDLVDKFNETLRFLNQNSDRGIGVLNQLKRMVLSPASEKSMELIGITTKSDGSLTFDREAFLNKSKESPSLVGDILEKVAGGIRNDAQMGMQESSGSLLGVQQYSQMGNSIQRSSFSFMSLYTRSGAYNMKNYYAVGSLMNLSI